MRLIHALYVFTAKIIDSFFTENKISMSRFSKKRKVMKLQNKHISLVLSVLLFSFSQHVFAESSKELEMVITAQNGKFTPATLELKENQNIKLSVKNLESSEIEFESYSLNKEEKIKPGKSKAIFIKDLKKGSYAFFDDNNENAKGEIIVK